MFLRRSLLCNFEALRGMAAAEEETRRVGCGVLSTLTGKKMLMTRVSVLRCKVCSRIRAVTILLRIDT